MKKKLFKSSLFVIVIVTVIALCAPFLLNNLKFGLDLQGGFEVLYKVESIDGSKLTSSMVTNTYKTISKRIDVLGVNEPSIVVEGENRIRVQLAGVTDSEEARNILSQAASLTFRDTTDRLLMNSSVLRSGGAKVTTDDYGKPAVSLTITDKDQFYKVTKAISKAEDNRIVIWLDFDSNSSFEAEQTKCGSLSNSKCLSVASVSQGFASDVIIQGSFTQEEVSNLVDLINSGSLPTKLTEISSKTVTATFGESSLNKTATAGVIGVILIILSMTVIYRFAGFVSSIGIVIYTFMTFLSFWLFGGVLTLPGIAALVIGIGMAIDACVINFARIKDELNDGVGLQGAYRKGNQNSFMAIFDANVTTLLVAVILFIFGESSVKGFATMLIISVIVTMFVMVFVTRFLLGVFVKTGFFDKKLKFFIGFKGVTKKIPYAKIDFVKIRKFAYIYLALLVIVGIGSLFINKLNLGIDFKGGSAITVIGNKDMTVKKVKEDINNLGYDLYEVEEVDSDTIIVKVTESLSKDEVLSTEKFFTDKYEAETDIGVISNVVKKDLAKNAIISFILACIGIIIYVSIRFRFSYAVGGIIALFHDTFAMIAIFSIFGIEVSSIFIAALLSIIGYSINDTIVTFDRIRENLNKKYNNEVKSEKQLAEIANLSLRTTLTRSIITTLMTLISVVCLIAFGAYEIINFNVALLIGLVFGTLSSIFIATQLWFDIERRNIGKTSKKKWYEED